MLIAINKQSKTRKFLENKQYKVNAYKDSDGLGLQEASKAEWECPFCGCEMHLVSFHKENEITPHGRAKNGHTGPMCDYIESGLDKKPSSKFKFLEKLNKTRKYAEIVGMSVMSINDLKDGIYEDAVFKVRRYQMKVIRVSEFNGLRYATINIGDPFKKGISLRILESELPTKDQEMIVCINNIEEQHGVNKDGPGTLKYCNKSGFKSFIKRKDGE